MNGICRMGCFSMPIVAVLAASLPCLAGGGGMRVGVIDWDCSSPSDTWFGGYQTRSLSPARYRYLTPYYADVLGPDKISYHRRTREEYDRELQYAIDAGIDYMAYCWYGDDPRANRVPLVTGRAASCEEHLWEITWARQFHMQSPLRDRLGLCAIVLGCHVYTDAEVAGLAEAMKESCYEKVAGGRPLVYLFGDATDGGILSRIRAAARVAGAGDPYVVAMHGTRGGLPTTGDRSVQARSAYAPPAPPRGGAFLRFPEFYESVRRENASWIAQGFDIVPAFATGRDHWPRIESPVPWSDNPPMRYASPATERELVECARDFKAFIDANAGKCPIRHVLTYAWNEFEEGAYICPLWSPNGPDTSRLAAFSKVVRIFKGENGVVPRPDDPLPDLADLRKRIPEIFRGAEGSFQRERFEKRLEAAERLNSLPERDLLMQAELNEFRAYFRDAIDHWSKDPLNPSVSPVSLDVRDYGARGDGETDNAEAFGRAMSAVRSLGGRPCILNVGPGDYLFGAADGRVEESPCNLDFSCVTNCVLKGQSPETTRFVFGRYNATGICYSRSVNSTLMNVDCRYAQRPFSQTVVESQDVESGTADVVWHPGTLRPDDPRYRLAKRSQVCCIFDADGKKADRGNSPFFALRADDLGNGRFRVYFDTSRSGISHLRLHRGDYLILPDRDNRYQGAAGTAAEFFNFFNVWYRNARSGAINCGDSHYSSASHCRTVPEGDGIVFSSNADTFYNSRGSFVAHCEFHHMCDDGANCLARGKEIYGRDGARSLVVREIEGRLGAGDVVQILDAMNGRFRATLRIAEMECFKTEKGAPRLRLAFDSDLPPDIVTVADVGRLDDASRYAVSHGLGCVRKAPDLLFAPLQYGTGFVCLSNNIHDVRGTGINIQCPHSIVEGNLIENVPIGIKMTGFTHWYEGTAPYDVVVRNNTIRNCGLGIQTLFSDMNGNPGAENSIRYIDISGNRLENVRRNYSLQTIEKATVDGKPFVAICNPAGMEQRTKNEGGAKRLLERTREIARSYGFPGVYFVAMRGMGMDYEDPAFLRQFADYGFDVTTVYGFRGGIPGSEEFDSRQRSFKNLADMSPSHWRALHRNGAIPFWPSISTGYDDRPWRGERVLEIRGYNVADFARICREARKFSDESGVRTFLLGPLDEWGEGSLGYPNYAQGFGILESVRETFGRKPSEGWPVNYAPEDVGRCCPQRTK